MSSLFFFFIVYVTLLSTDNVNPLMLAPPELITKSKEYPY